jgi:hypothetical protein
MDTIQVLFSQDYCSQHATHLLTPAYGNNMEQEATHVSTVVINNILQATNVNTNNLEARDANTAINKLQQ